MSSHQIGAVTSTPSLRRNPPTEIADKVEEKPKNGFENELKVEQLRRGLRAEFSKLKRDGQTIYDTKGNLISTGNSNLLKTQFIPDYIKAADKFAK